MPGGPLLHVGMHKTGSTSIQQFLRDHTGDLLASVGASLPAGFLIPELHSDLPLLVIRPDRTWPARLRFPETQDPRWQAAATAHVRAAVADAPTGAVVWSHEDLSYVRFDDELDRLRDLVGAAARVVIYRRARADFLRSYREQLEATGFAVSDDPTSFAYVETDSWVADHESVVAAYQRGFGPDAVTVIDYDEVVACDGSVIPSFTDLLGIPRRSLPSLESYFFNRSGGQLRVSDEHLAAIRRRAVEQSRG